MLIKELSLSLDYPAAGLHKPEKAPAFTGYILENSKEYCKDRKRPAVLLCPGGGYQFTSDRESEPVAMKFLSAGISVFLLRYTCGGGAFFPHQLCEAAAAMRVIRSHGEEWNLDEKKIAVCGFSAGGHLAASLGVFWNSDLLKVRQLGGEVCRPNGLLLCYPVITSGVHGHRGSFENLLGPDAGRDALLFLTSLERQVTKETPPTFLWHTWTDEGVPVQNSLLFASALADAGVPAELHIYPRGGHGLSLCNSLTATTAQGVLPEAQDWIDRAAQFIHNL